MNFSSIRLLHIAQYSLGPLDRGRSVDRLDETLVDASEVMVRALPFFIYRRSIYNELAEFFSSHDHLLSKKKTTVWAAHPSCVNLLSRKYVFALVEINIFGII